MRTGVYFLPRAQAAKARAIGAEPRVIVPAARLMDRVEQASGPAPAKLSYDEALACFGVRQGR